MENKSLQDLYYFPVPVDHLSDTERVKVKKEFHQTVKFFKRFTKNNASMIGFFSTSGSVISSSMCFFYKTVEQYDIFVTCAHCIDDTTKKDMSISHVSIRSFLGFSFGKTKKNRVIYRVIKGTNADIAFLFVEKQKQPIVEYAKNKEDYKSEVNPFCFTLRHTFEHPYTYLFFTGMFTDVFCVAYRQYGEPMVSKNMSLLLDNRNYLVQKCDMITHSGCSGSPVIGASGKIYGMLQGGPQDERRTSTIIPMIVIDTLWRKIKSTL